MTHIQGVTMTHTHTHTGSHNDTHGVENNSNTHLMKQKIELHRIITVNILIRKVKFFPSAQTHMEVDTQR